MSEPTTAACITCPECRAADRVKWVIRTWREVAHDFCSHEGVGKSCVKCRAVVSDMADLFTERASR